MEPKKGNKNDKVSFHLQGVFLQTKFSRKQVSSDVLQNIIRAEQKRQNLLIFHKNLIIQQGYFQWLFRKAIYK